MLSRVAEAVYWIGRYIERAEDLTRLLAVNFNALLESQPETREILVERMEPDPVPA